MKKIILTLMVGVCYALSVSGQALDVTHFMRISPFQHNNLPSSSTIYNGYFSLPTGNIQAGVNLGAIRYKNLFETDEEGYPTVLTATKFVNSLSNKNYFGVYDDIELLGVGFRIKDRYFLTVDYRQRANLDFIYSRDVLGLPIYGNMAYVDNPADLNLSINLNAYQELGVSFRHKVNNRISWGVRPKVLFGLANVNTQTLSAQVATNPNDYTISMRYAAALRAAAIVPFTMTFNPQDGFQFDADYNVGIILKNAFKNAGFGIDLGFSYKFMESLGLSAGVLDLGFINWKTSTTSMSSSLDDAGSLYNEGAFTFSGLTQSDIDAIMEEGSSGILDTLAQYFPLEIVPTGSYMSALTPRVVLQADYEFAKFHRVSVATQFRFANKYFQPSLTVAYDGLFFNSIDVCVAYTIQRNSYDNLGVGLGFNLGYLNIYAGTQNIIAAFSVKNVSQLTATAGVVFNWGHYKNWREKYPKKEKKPKEGKKRG
jgi:hypothetical protein